MKLPLEKRTEERGGGGANDFEELNGNDDGISKTSYMTGKSIITDVKWMLDEK